MMMATTKRSESLPRSVEQLEALATYYDSHDTSSEMEGGQWVDPQPMKTTSLRLPSDVVETLKSLAQAKGQRYTAFVREILEQAVSGANDDVVRSIDRRLAKIEKVVVGKSAVAPHPERAPKIAAAPRRHSSVMARKVAGRRETVAKAAKQKGKTHRRG